MDTAILTAINGYAGQSVALDLIIDYMQGSYFVKGLFAVAVLLAVYSSSNPPDRRAHVLATLLTVFAAVFLARILQMTLPFNPRPLHTEGLDLNLAAGINRSILSTDSSFPSDHAVMYFALAACAMRYARLAGAILLIHAIFIISLPRIYLGFHWPSDILAGAALGTIIALLLQDRVARMIERLGVIGWSERHPAPFNIAMFTLMAETATLYSGSRHLLSSAGEFVSLVF